MKILVLSNFADSLVRLREALLQTMLKKGHKVIACATEASEEIEERLKVIGVRYQPVSIERNGVNPLRDLYTLLELWAIFRRIKPDMVFSYTIKPVIYGSIAAKLANVPRSYSLITGLGYAFTGKDLKGRLVNNMVKLLYRVSMRYNHQVFFQNPDDAKFFVDSKFITTKQAVVVNGSGIDVDAFQPLPFPEKICFLQIARLIKEKGIREYAEAATIIKRKYPDVTFRLVGLPWKGYSGAISEQELQAWQEQGIIEFLGGVPDVRSALAASSVYVLPSYYREGIPRTILEAMAMGRAIITTDAPGCRETVQHGKNGLLIPIKDVPALVVALERFIQQPGLIEQMGQCSRQTALDKYDVHKVNAAMLKRMGIH